MEVVNSFEHQNDLFIKSVYVLDNLVLNFLITDIQPIRKIVSQFFLMKLNFLPNI